MEPLQNAARILDDLRDILAAVDPQKAELICSDISKANRVFVAGAGRSLLMMRAFAMRLMHLGFVAYVVGETVTPAIGKGDLLLIGTASGETATLKVVAEKAKKAGAGLDVLTIYENSSIGKLADSILVIPAATNQVEDGKVSWQPGGSSFEQSLLILLDGMVVALARQMGIPLSGALNLHANLE